MGGWGGGGAHVPLTSCQNAVICIKRLVALAIIVDANMGVCCAIEQQSTSNKKVMHDFDEIQKNTQSFLYSLKNTQGDRYSTFEGLMFDQIKTKIDSTFFNRVFQLTSDRTIKWIST